MSAALLVIADQLRTLGLEDVARWVEHPEAVRELLGHDSHDAHDGLWCASCGSGEAESHGNFMDGVERCRVAAAWRALGDPRGAADIERAHEEALRQAAIDGLRATSAARAARRDDRSTPNSAAIDALAATFARGGILPFDGPDGPGSREVARVVTLADGTRAFRTRREIFDATVSSPGGLRESPEDVPWLTRPRRLR